MQLWYPYYRLKEEGYETFTIGPEKGKTYNSKHGYPCKAEEGIDDVRAEVMVASFMLLTGLTVYDFAGFYCKISEEFTLFVSLIQIRLLRKHIIQNLQIL